jgi:hypothetical protein
LNELGSVKGLKIKDCGPKTLNVLLDHLDVLLDKNPRHKDYIAIFNTKTAIEEYLK